MKKRIVLAALCLLSFCSQVWALTPLMPVENLRAGMRGYAKTVISGDTIETFPVEILGVTGSDTMGYQILIRAEGAVIERSGGIAQGMSGSPVYIDGRLAGAIAYGKAFTDPHYCFLTPIQDMLALLDKPVSHHGAAAKADAPSLLPKGTVLMAGGFTSAGFALLQDALAEEGLSAVDTGSGGGPAGSGELEPGSSVGVALVQGDLTLGALGTVTWTDDRGRILAFGHPFMQRGDAGFFMTRSWVLASLPNLQAAYKVGTVGTAIGTIVQDRMAGVAGQLGKLPPYIPVYVSAADMTRSHNGSARVRVVDDPRLAPGLISSVVASQAARAADHNTGGSARIVFDIQAMDGNDQPLRITRENMYFDNKSILKQLPAELEEATRVLLQNKLETVNITSIDVTLELSTESLVAEIQKVSVQEKKPSPGDIIHLDVVLKPYRSGEITRTVSYRLPEDASGTVRLNVRGGASLNWIQELLRQQKEEGVPQAKRKEKQKKKEVRLQDYVKEINTADRNNDIIVEYATADRRQERAAGKKELPEEAESMSFSALLAGGRNKQSTPVDLIIDGEAQVTVELP